MTIPALPALSRTSPTFRADLDALFLTQLPATTGAINAAILDIDADVLAAEASATAAAGSATTATTAKVDAQLARDAAQASVGQALAAGSYKGLWSDLTGSLARPASAKHLGTIWLLNADLPDVTAAQPGVSPAWARAGRTGTSDWVVVTGSITASAGDALFVDTTAAPVSITLPPTAFQGDSIAFADHAGFFAVNNLTVLRNGKNIGGIADDMVVDVSRAAFNLIFSNTKGWVFA